MGVMSDTINDNVLKISFKAAKLAGMTLMEIIKIGLTSLNNRPVKSLQKLSKEGVALDTTTVSKEQVADLIKRCKKYNIHVAITSDVANPGNVSVFFRSKQNVVLQKTLLDIINDTATKTSKTSTMEKIKEAVEKTKEYVPTAEKIKSKDIVR